MKASNYILGLALLTLASCSSGLYVGTEYDDLYYVSSDQPVTKEQDQRPESDFGGQSEIRVILRQHLCR